MTDNEHLFQKIVIVIVGMWLGFTFHAIVICR